MRIYPFEGARVLSLCVFFSSCERAAGQRDPIVIVAQKKSDGVSGLKSTTLAAYCGAAPCPTFEQSRGQLVVGKSPRKDFGRCGDYNFTREGTAHESRIEFFEQDGHLVGAIKSSDLEEATIFGKKIECPTIVAEKISSSLPATLEREEVRNIMRANSHEFSECGALIGTKSQVVDLKFDIRPSGNVRIQKIDAGNTLPEAAKACVERTLSRMAFPPHETGNIQVSFPLKLEKFTE